MSYLRSRNRAPRDRRIVAQRLAHRPQADQPWRPIGGSGCQHVVPGNSNVYLPDPIVLKDDGRVVFGD